MHITVRIYFDNGYMTKTVSENIMLTEKQDYLSGTYSRYLPYTALTKLGIAKIASQCYEYPHNDGDNSQSYYVIEIIHYEDN